MLYGNIHILLHQAKSYSHKSLIQIKHLFETVSCNVALTGLELAMPPRLASAQGFVCVCSSPGLLVLKIISHQAQHKPSFVPSTCFDRSVGNMLFTSDKALEQFWTVPTMSCEKKKHHYRPEESSKTFSPWRKLTEKSHTKECLILTSLTFGKHVRVPNHSKKEVALTSFNHIDKRED